VKVPPTRLLGPANRAKRPAEPGGGAIDPASLLGRLQTLGFDKITVMMDGIVKFVASKPAGPGCGDEDDGHDDGDGTQAAAEAPGDAP
jgi:hypothetical protein